MPRSRVTMEDVGRHAGVSMVTVSRVINKPEIVAEPTRERVLRSISALGFTPDNAARLLARRRSRLIDLLSTGLAQHSHSKRMVAFNEAARRAGYQVIMATVAEPDGRRFREAVDTMMSQRVESIVLIAADAASVAHMRELELQIPVIFAESGGESGADNVSIDQSRGGQLAVAHLADLGHEAIAHIAGPPHSLDARERLAGWQSEIGRRGLVAAAPVRGDWSAESGYRAALEILDRDDGTTAIFVSSDQMALGVLHALAESGRAAPAGMSVVGFDDIPGAAHFIPPLTTLRQDFDQLAAQMLRVVVERLEEDASSAPARVVPELVVRRSTAGPPRRSDGLTPTP